MSRQINLIVTGSALHTDNQGQELSENASTEPYRQKAMS